MRDKGEGMLPGEFGDESCVSGKDVAPPAPSRFYVPALDGLRTVAFLMIWTTHALSTSGGQRVPLSLRDGFVVAGSYGVPVFFVLSAFLITRLLLLERERTGGIDVRAYYVRRTLRIWPLYYLFVGLALLPTLLHGKVQTSAALALLTFTANWHRAFIGELPGFSGVLWSLSVEEQFYLVWPFVIAGLSRSSLKKVCVAMIVVALLSRLLATSWSPVPYWPVWNATTSHFDSLALGTLLALGSHRLPRLGGLRWYAAFVACLSALAVQAALFPIVMPGVQFGIGTPIAFTIVPFIATGMVALAVIGEKTLLERPAMVWVGRLTYGMYLFHVVALTSIHGRSPLLLAASLLATLALAWLSYHLYEKRFIRLKHRFERIDTRPAN